MTVHRVKVADGVALHVHRWLGGAAPFLLVHGLASNLHLWDGVAEVLASRGHAVVAVDLRGHGRSDKPDGGYDLATVAADLAQLVTALDLDRPVATGQSWGGNVVLELAWRAPALLRGVAGVDGGWIDLRRRFPAWEECATVLAPPSTAGVAAAELAARLRARHSDWPEAGVAGALACYEHLADGTVRPWLDLEHHLAILRDLWEHPPSPRYREVKVPVLLIPADTGEAPDGEWARQRRILVEEAAAALPDCEVVWMAGDHDLHAQRPEQVAELLHRATVDGCLAP
jgi:pimeloyl-ACP methyl ester carboxylesterase